MRKLVFLIALILLATSCSLVIQSVGDITAGYSENPFLEKNAIKIDASSLSSENYTEDTIRFFFLTDFHWGRNLKEGFEDKITYFDREIIDFLGKNGEYPFMINGGDYLDSDKTPMDSGSDAMKYLEELKSYVNGTELFVVGNHEYQIFPDPRDTEALLKPVLGDYANSMGRYEISFKGHDGDPAFTLSIYKIDNATRIIGKTQFDWLEEALEGDSNRFKMIVAHENMSSGRLLDQSLYFFGSGDSEEKARLFSHMMDYGAKILMTGHTHDSNLDYELGKGAHELNFGAAHRAKSIAEGNGNFFVFTLKSDGTFSVQGYDAETESEVSDIAWTFKI